MDDSVQDWEMSMKWVKYGLIAVLLATVAAALHYALPQVDVVRIVGTDVKRVDAPRETNDTTGEPTVRTADVYFILAETESGAVRNYRNEDAFLYGKFDSADLHTRARSISQNENNLVAVRHYGWRIPLFSLFPNATSIWEVSPGYAHMPIFNIVVLVLMAVGVGYGAWRIRRFRRRLLERQATREAERAEEHARRDQQRAAAPREDPERDKALQEFIRDAGPGSDRQTSERE